MIARDLSATNRKPRVPESYSTPSRVKMFGLAVVQRESSSEPMTSRASAPPTLAEPPAPEPELELLVARARSGDREAFGALVSRFEGRVRSYCALMLGRRGGADDAAQDVFLRAFERLAGLRGDGSFAVWLLTLARNRCLDELRRRSRWRFRSVDAPANAPDGLPADALEPSPPAAHEERDILNRVLERLPSNYREILILKEHHGMSYEEIGAVLKLSLDGVKGQVKRARERCESILRHLEGELDV